MLPDLLACKSIRQMFDRVGWENFDRPQGEPTQPPEKERRRREEGEERDKREREEGRRGNGILTNMFHFYKTK